MQPLISCIIPIYNSKQYLCRCLDSIINQSYSNIEIILIDDGSDDGSGCICDNYAQIYSNVRVLHIPNGGASLARKKGIELSNGEYLTFVDSDDYISDEYISLLYKVIKKNKTKISACKVQRTNENEAIINYNNCDYNEQLLSFDKIMPRFFRYEFWALYGKLYSKDVLKNLFFPKATLSEDYVVMIQVLCKEKQMSYIDAPLYFYEFHENSLSHQQLSGRAFEEFDNVKYVWNYTLENCAEYSDYALSNVVETSVKLFFMKSDNDRYQKRFSEIRMFLKDNRYDIFRNRILLLGVKILALGIILSPIFTIKIFNWIKREQAIL